MLKFLVARVHGQGQRVFDVGHIPRLKGWKGEGEERPKKDAKEPEAGDGMVFQGVGGGPPAPWAACHL